MKMEVRRLLDEIDQLQSEKEQANKLTMVAQKHVRSFVYLIFFDSLISC